MVESTGIERLDEYSTRCAATAIGSEGCLGVEGGRIQILGCSRDKSTPIVHRCRGASIGPPPLQRPRLTAPRTALLARSQTQRL